MNRLVVITGLCLLLPAPAALADDCPPCPCVAAGAPVTLEIPGFGTVVVSNGGPTRPAARGTTKRSTTKRSTTKRKHRHPRRKRPGASTTPKFTG
jgi:hypothetical protein